MPLFLPKFRPPPAHRDPQADPAPPWMWRWAWGWLAAALLLPIWAIPLLMRSTTGTKVCGLASFGAILLSVLLSCALSGIATLFGVVAYRRQPRPRSPRLLAALAVLSAPILATLLVALLLVAA